MSRNLLLGLIFVLCLVSFISPSLAWWNGSWQYRRPITINNTQNSNSLTDYQILVTVDTATLISDGKMRSDCGDIRFVDSDDSTKLSYWIESGCNSSNTKIWVKVPSIPASSTKTIYMYYGNPNATSESNGSAVFDFFDDASSDKTDEYTRTAPYSWSYGEGYLTWNSGYYTGNITTSGGATYWVHSTQVPENFSFYAKVKDPHTSDNTQVGIAIHGNTENILARRVYAGTIQVINLFREDSSGSYKICESNIDATNTNWHKLEMKKFGNTWKIYYDDSEICSGTYTPADSNYHVSLYIAWNSNTEVYWDDIRVRKYTDPEPTTSVGSEQSSYVQITIYSPENKTYYTTEIEVNVSTSSEASSYTCNITNDGNLIGTANETSPNFTTTITNTGGSHNVSVKCITDGGYESNKTVNYYVWMGLNISVYYNDTGEPAQNWSLTITNGTATYTAENLSNPVMLEWNEIPYGTINVTVDDDSDTLYYFPNTTQVVNNESTYTILNLTLYLKPPNEITLTASPGWNVLEGQSVTISCSVSEGTPILKIDNVIVSNPYTFTTTVGSHSVVCSIEETDNYRPNEESKTLVVNPLVACTNNQTFAFSTTIQPQPI